MRGEESIRFRDQPSCHVQVTLIAITALKVVALVAFQWAAWNAHRLHHQRASLQSSLCVAFAAWWY